MIASRRLESPVRRLIRCATMEPPPDEAPRGAYGGSRVVSDLEVPDPHAFAGRGDLAPSQPEAGAGAADEQILRAVGEQADWMNALLADLVRAPTTLGDEESGQAIVEEAIRELGLDPVDVPMDADRLRRHPLAAPFDWDVGGKRNVVATWGGGDRLLRAIAHPQRPYRRREPRAAVAVGWCRAVRGRARRRVDGGPWGGRHEVRPGRHPRRGEGPARTRAHTERPSHDRVGRRRGVLGQRHAADPARRLHRRCGRHRRAVRGRDHDVAGRCALVQRSHHGRRGPRRRGRAHDERDREEPRGDRRPTIARGRAERSRPRPRTTCSPTRST